MEFKCKVSGKPSILTTWLKDGKKLEKEGCTFKIPNAKLEDQGKYTCIVRNKFGEHKCIVALTVKGKTEHVFYFSIISVSVQCKSFHQGISKAIS